MVVSFSFHDKDGEPIQNIDASDRFPDQAVSLKIKGPFDSDTSSCQFLTTMLNVSQKKLEQINIQNLSAESPDFLAFLLLICNKTNALYLDGCSSISRSEAACLMSGLLPCDGIRSLSFSLAVEEAIGIEQMKILLEGVALSPCLETFELKVHHFENNHELSHRYLVQALERNQRLKNITLFTDAFFRNEPAALPDIVRASIMGRNMKTLSIISSCLVFSEGRMRVSFEEHLLPLDVLQDVLCRQDCTLETLYLQDVNISTEGRWNVPTVQNSSVTSLKVNGKPLTTSNISKILRLFKSLEELDLRASRLTELSFLDPLLLGERSQLKSLDVSYNDIGEEEMNHFAEKLRTIRGMKNLAVWHGNWKNRDALVARLVNAVQNDMDLERCDFGEADLPLDLNRGGRRIFESPEAFPRNLLSRVFERASKISYYNCPRDNWGEPTNKEARVDVIFWMIQRIAPQL